MKINLKSIRRAAWNWALCKLFFAPCFSNLHCIFGEEINASEPDCNYRDGLLKRSASPGCCCWSEKEFSVRMLCLILFACSADYNAVRQRSTAHLTDGQDFPIPLLWVRFFHGWSSKPCGNGLWPSFQLSRSGSRRSELCNTIGRYNFRRMTGPFSIDCMHSWRFLLQLNLSHAHYAEAESQIDSHRMICWWRGWLSMNWLTGATYRRPWRHQGSPQRFQLLESVKLSAKKVKVFLHILFKILIARHERLILISDLVEAVSCGDIHTQVSNCDLINSAT